MTTTKEQLFADLEKDGISNNYNQITRAKNGDGDGDAMYKIGREYYYKKKYDKAMAWYRLAADKNNSDAQNNIGFLYYYGNGVPKDYLLAMEWYLKAAMQNDKNACYYIGNLFKEGEGVPVNKYKALEWFYKKGEDSYSFNKLTKQGYQLTQQDKNKSIEQLVKETEDIAWPERRTLKEKQLMNKTEEESAAKGSKIKALQEENQTLRLTSEHQQQELLLKQESIEQYKTNVQTINNELETLKQESHTLKLKLEEEIRARNNEINSLKEEVQSLRLKSEHQQQELDVKQESIEQYKRKEQIINSEVQSLKQANHTFGLKMEDKEIAVSALQSENKALRALSENSTQGTNKRMEELEKSNHTFEKLLEQERQLKDGQFALMKEKMEMSLEKEKQKRNELQERYQAIKRELKSIRISTQQNSSLKKNSFENSTSHNTNTSNSGNDTDYDTECDDSDNNNNDINYDTPSDDNSDDDNNDLNYDSDK